MPIKKSVNRVKKNAIVFKRRSLSPAIIDIDNPTANEHEKMAPLLIDIEDPTEIEHQGLASTIFDIENPAILSRRSLSPLCFDSLKEPSKEVAHNGNVSNHPTFLIWSKIA